MSDWSCVIDSFAYATNQPVERLVGLVGHDGSEIMLASLPDPYGRRGFSIDEMAIALLSQGIACVYIPKRLVWFTPNSQFYILPERDMVAPHLGENSYVLISDSHAVGVRAGVLYDPAGQHETVATFPYEGIIICKNFSK